MNKPVMLNEQQIELIKTVNKVKYGEVRIVIQDGKVIRVEVVQSVKIADGSKEDPFADLKITDLSGGD